MALTHMYEAFIACQGEFTCGIPIILASTLRGIIVPISQVMLLKPREVKPLVQTQVSSVLEFTLTSVRIEQPG